MTSTVNDCSLPPPPTSQPLQCSVCAATHELKCCSRCRSVYYCCRQHQELDWKRHRSACDRLQQQQPPLPRQQQQQPPMTSNSCMRLPSHPSTAAIHNDLMATAVGHQSDVSTLLMTPNGGQQHNHIMKAMNGMNSDHRHQQQPQHESLSQMNGTIDNNNHQSSTMTSPVNPIDHLLASGGIQSRPAPPHDLILTKLNSYCESIVRDLDEFGFCVIDDFLSNGQDIMAEVYALYKCGLFRAGQVVNTKATVNSQLIRGDHIVWVDGTEQMCANIGFLVQTLDSIVMRCNTMSGVGQFAKYRINRRTKAMIACYPGNNSQYVRHIDNPNNDGRCVTSIYYLNKDYNRQRDGGVLRLFPQLSTCVADIEPKFNRVIFFWSDRRNPHEVMPSSRMRFAITVWYFDANERERAIQRYKQESRCRPLPPSPHPPLPHRPTATATAGGGGGGGVVGIPARHTHYPLVSHNLMPVPPVPVGRQYPVDKDLRPF